MDVGPRRDLGTSKQTSYVARAIPADLSSATERTFHIAEFAMDFRAVDFLPLENVFCIAKIVI